MLDVEPGILAELRGLAPLDSALTGDWDAVLAAARDSVRRVPTRRRLAFGLAGAAAALIIIGSALGAAGIGPLSPLRAWLRGTPGKPASPAAIRAFQVTNGHSWASFPRSTKLRELITHTFEGQRYVLYGFRSGNSVCLTLRAVTLRASFGPACAPVSVIEDLSTPVVAVAADRYVYAFPERRSAHVSFGIVADQVQQLDVETVNGSHRAALGGNAYLWVDPSPASFDRVVSLNVTTTNRHHVSQAVTTPDPSVIPSTPTTLHGPTHVQETIRDPHVGWFRRGQKRGLSLRQARLTARQGQVITPGTATRFFKPDPTSDIVVGFDGGCIYLDNGSSCSTPAQLFTRGPLNYMITGGGGVNTSDQFSTVGGIAADGVTAVRAILPNGTPLKLALSDNVFAGVVPNVTPLRVVAYGRDGKVVGIETLGDARPAPPEARNLQARLSTVGPGGTRATLSLGKTVKGVRCWKLTTTAERHQGECDAQLITGPWVMIRGVQNAGQAVFVFGTVREPVTAAYMQFDDGVRTPAKISDGWFLAALPATEISTARHHARVVGTTVTGRTVQQPAFFYKLAN